MPTTARSRRWRTAPSSLRRTTWGLWATCSTSWRIMDSTSNRKSRAGSSSSGAIRTEDELLRAAVQDALRLCERRNAPRFLGFLDGRQRAAVQELFVCRAGGQHPLLRRISRRGRVFLGVFPAYGGRKHRRGETAAVFPITALGFRYRARRQSTHPGLSRHPSFLRG